jgi:hypothetical protein
MTAPATHDVGAEALRRKSLRAGVVLAILVCLPGAAAAAESPTPAARLWTVIDLARPELAEVRGLVDKGDDRAALRAFVAVVAKRMASLPPQRGYGMWLHAPADADELLAGRLTTARYGDTSVHYTAEIGLPGHIDFFKAAPDYPLTIRDISTMHWANKHAEAYARSRDVKYLRAWCTTWADFATHWAGQFAAVQKNPDVWGKGPDGQQRVLGIGWVGGTLSVAWRLQAIREGLVGILQTASAAGQLDAIDTEAVALLLVRLATGEAPTAVRLLGRAESTTPNQAREMAMNLFRIGCLFPEFKDAATWRSKPLAVVFLTNLPDGTDREQSLNYFNNQFKELPGLIERDVPPGERDPALLARIDRASAYRDRFPPSIAMPDGNRPATGSDPAWRTYGKPRKLAPPSQAFTSILFPYGGFAVQRDGWTPESLYLFMKACRPSRGHWRSQDGGLQLAAFGRTLLVSPIGETYDARDVDRGWRLYWDSSVSQNAVLVDGMAAAERRGDFLALDPMRWHAGGRIDFMETEIRGPYQGSDFRRDGAAFAKRRAKGKGSTAAAVTDVVHRRQVHFLRDLGAWIVTDRITSDTAHDFTQTWCLGPEYAEGDVIAETVTGGHGGRIATTKPDEPNLSLHQVATVKLAHERFCGVYGDDRILGWVGILADHDRWIYTPAVNVHTSWRGRGPQCVVTLMVPHRGQASPITLDAMVSDAAAGIAGFDATRADGARIAFRAASSPVTLEAGGRRAKATSLLVVRTADGGTSGAALDAATLDDRATATRDFEFVTPADGDTTQVPIRIPTGFEWRGQGDTLVPAYDRR